jgi:two-component system cell cycle response regulator DivK
MKNRILVVEDDPASRELLCDWLDAEGYDVLEASTLAEAFSGAQQHLPHAVLLDVSLGAEDGLEFTAWLRQQPALRHLPVIAVTAHAMVGEQARTLHAGCNAFVPKPVDFNALRQHLQRWLAWAEKAER